MISGKQAERLAVLNLRKAGYCILAKNYRTSFGEIDIVAQRGKTLIFCEVKSKTATFHGQPFEAVTPLKQERLKKLAQAYIQKEKPTFQEVRFDVISILFQGKESQVIHISDAFR
jgi:putative endonuclease